MPDRLNAIRGGNMGSDEYRVLNKPRAFVARFAAHNIANGGGLVPLQWDTKVYDTDSMWNPNASAALISRLTCNTPGEYDCFGFAVWPSNSTSYRQMSLVVNGGVRFSNVDPPVNGAIFGQEISRRVTLNKDDYIELHLGQNTVTNPLVLPATATVSVYDHGLQVCHASTLG